MKRKTNILKIATIFTSFALGFAYLTSNFAKPSTRLNAEQHVNYIYSGIHYNAASANEDSNWNINLSLRGAEFRNALQTIMAGKKTVTTSYSNCLELGARAAAYPNASSSTFVPFYHDSSVTATTGQCNREHTWPNSRGTGTSGPGADPFIIRPTLTSENSDRQNYFYGTRGKNNKEWDPASCGFEGARGESARVILYAATMYYKQGLSLSNNPNDDTSLKTMGTLSTLLTWNTTYAPTPIEIQVNNYLSDNGYGRNPFVDHPEYASYIWNSNGLIEGGTSQDPTGITLNKSSLSLSVGATSTLTATLQPSGATGTVTWLSSNTTIATVNNGTVRGVAAGTAVITAKVSDSIKATCAVTVTSSGGSGGQTEEIFEKASSIEAGDTVFLATENASKQYAGPSGTSATAYGLGDSYTNEPDKTKYALEVEAGSASNTYSFKIKSGDNANKYLSWSSDNSLAVSTVKNANSSWVVSFDNSYNATIKNSSNDARVIWWNASSPRFACYTGKSEGSGFKYVQLWKLTSSSVPEPETYLESATAIKTIRGDATVTSSTNERTITFSTLGLTSGTQYLEPFDGGIFTITFAGDENDGKYYTTGSAIRTYSGGTITIASKTSDNISNIVFTWASDSNKPASNDVVDVGTYDSSNAVWTGSANSVVLTRPNTGSGHWRLQSVKVTCGSKAITINQLDLRFGIKVPTTDWDALDIEDYGIMVFLTHSLNNVATVESRYNKNVDLDNQELVAVGRRGSSLAPAEDGQGNYNFTVRISIPDNSWYDAIFCVRPFIVIEDEVHFILEEDIQESVRTLAIPTHNSGTNFEEDVLSYLAGN